MKKIIIFAFVLLTIPLSYAQNYDGIDISHHNGRINWRQLPKTLDFIYIKATEGGTYVDQYYIRNVDSATLYKFNIGSYHYFRMTSSAEKQFANFKKTVVKAKQKLIPMVDVELNGKDDNGWNIDGYHTSVNAEKNQIIKSLKTLLANIEKEYGCRPMIYCTWAAYVQVVKGNFDNYKIYLGNYAPTPKINNYTIWQYSEKESITGIPKHTDVCVFNKGKCIKDIEMPNK